LVRTAVVELLERAPSPEVQAPVVKAIEKGSRDFVLGPHHLRMTKMGRKVYVEVAFLVPHDYRVRDADRVRRRLVEEVARSRYDYWLSVEFTADPASGE
jgi:predicted Co/Zn/Cd cation transporter (cation efflux family)